MKLTRELLESYSSLDREINMLEDKLHYFASKQIPAEHGVVQSSMKDYPYAPTHLVLSGSDIKSDEEHQKRLKQKIIELSSKKRAFEELEIEVDDAIEEIKDLEIKQIIEMKYILGLTDMEIADELGYHRTYIGKKIKDFLQTL